LMIAAQNGHTETVAELLAQKANVNAARSDGVTALIFAAQDGHTEIVTELLDRGADVNAANSDGVTALTFATYKGHTETVNKLHVIERLITAAKNGDAETVFALLSHDGVDLQTLQSQLSHPSLRNLNKKVSVLLAVILPNEEVRNLITTEEASSFILPVILPDNELRNSIITSFNKRNPRNAINQENNDILGSGLEMYKTLKDLESSYKKNLTDSGVPEDKAEDLANQRFFKLFNDQDFRREVLAGKRLVTDLTSKSASLATDLVGLNGLTEIVNPLFDVEALGKDRANQASASPATIMQRSKSTASITASKKGNWFSKP